MAEKVIVQLVLDTSRYTSNATKAAQSTDKIRQSADKTTKSVGSLRSTALKAGAALGAAFAAKAALDFAKSSIAAFSSLEESVNAVEVSFGDASAGVLALGENSATQFGLSTRAVNQAAVAMSAFASKIDEADPADAFENVLQRATDFASVMDLDVEEALVLFRSGLAGESEPLRKFGIDVSAATVTAVGLAAGLGGVNGKLDEGEKVQARYLAIMEQTEKTAGDFANTAEGLANRQRTLSAEWEEAQAVIGKELEPVMLKLLSAGTKLIPVVSSLAGVVGVLVDKAVAAVDPLEEIFDLISQAVGTTDEASESAGGFSVSIEDIANAAVFAVSPLADLGAGMLDTAADMVAFATGAEEVSVELVTAAEQGEALDSTFATLTRTTDGFATAGDAARGSLSVLRRSTVQASGAAKTAAERFQDQANAIRDTARAAAEAASPLLRLLRTQRTVVEAQTALAEAQEDAEISAEDLRDANLDLLEAQLDLRGASADAAGVIGEGSAVLFELAKNAGISEQVIRDLIAALDDLPSAVNIDINARPRNFGRVEGLIGGGDFGIPGARQHGGSVSAGQPYRVGEAGPEVFVPDSAGRIVANNDLGGTTINIYQPETTDLASDLAAGLIAGQVTRQVEMLGV